LMGGPGTPDYVDDSRQDFDQKGQPNVMISFNSLGDAAWAKATKKAADNKFQIAIVLDDIVYSAPSVGQQITGGGMTTVTGSFSMVEAQELASVLKSGKLRVTTTIEGIVVVGPSLGKEAVDRGLLSLASGLAIVIIFMMMYYGKGGTIANIALLFNIFFILGILSVPSLGAALTLPGIAGIVLTMGMSIDANVLIFERIKEEIKNGVAVKSAIQIGYKKAFVTILDANVTTLITAIILFAFGTGVVKGFATTLIIGVLSSFFSAVYITRLIIEFIMNRNADANMSFETSISRTWFTKINFDIISKRKIAYIISAVVITIGMSTVVMQDGLNLGVDFQGGRSYIVKFDKDVQVGPIRTDLKKVFGDASCEVKTFDGDQNVQIKTNYMLSSTDEKVDSIVKATLLSGLVSFDQLNPQVVQSIKVNPTISADIKEKSLESVLISLIAIFLYIRVRFKKWQFGVGALIALFHDVLVVISVFSIARLFGVNFEIDSIFIASMLTIVGYSVNDTVVVFDRVREFLGKNAKMELAPLFNDAINSTMSRTVMTSLTTLVVVAILLVFGGDALRGFSFALFIGIIVGTYSSIFIATPVVLDTSKKKMLDVAEEAQAKKEAKEEEETTV
jgi:SecD/SecF fusion protein